MKVQNARNFIHRIWKHNDSEKCSSFSLIAWSVVNVWKVSQCLPIEVTMLKQAWCQSLTVVRVSRLSESLTQMMLEDRLCQVCWRTSCLRTSCDDYDRIITVTSIVITLCQEITYKRSFTINRLLRSSSTFCLVSHSLFSCAYRHSIQCRRRLFSSLYRSSDMSPNAKNEALVPPTPVTHVIFDMDGLLIGMYLLTHNSFCSNLIVSEPSL